MFYKKAQREIFNAMLSENTRAGKFALENGKILITINGTVGWAFPESVLQINAEKLRDIPALNTDGFISKENELEQTIDFVLADQRSKTLVQRYRKGKTSVFINPKLLQHFQNPTLYQKDAPLGVIVVTEQYRNGTNEIVGVVCPVRDRWSERYADYF